MTTSIHDDTHPCVNDDNEKFTKTIFDTQRAVVRAIMTPRAHAEGQRSCVSTTFRQREKTQRVVVRAITTPRAHAEGQRFHVDKAKTRRGLASLHFFKRSAAAPPNPAPCSKTLILKGKPTKSITPRNPSNPSHHPSRPHLR